jgi:hypothetical protein
LISLLDSIMESGYCIECGAKEQDGLSCSEQLGYLLVWEHNNPKLYDLHFWTVSNYMLQHPSSYTKEGYEQLKSLFCDAYDYNWDISYILKRNREATTNKKIKIVNPTHFLERVRVLCKWTMTASDVYAAGENNAIENVKKWRENIRTAL